ncbi:MAG: hypothetical protein K6F84_02080 [Lachnospiraceae bacterium]|nr:hypothetical protein [Lachnospiraceae bacterium]
MRYSIFDLQVEDIMWFGIDTNGMIFACTSAGCANVPEFVCESREINEQICNFFMNMLERTTTEVLEAVNENNVLINDAIKLSQKGIFCFDAVIDDEVHANEYVRISSPSAPLRFEKLPDSIKSVFKGRIINVDITSTKYLQVNHAY